VAAAAIAGALVARSHSHPSAPPVASMTPNPPAPAAAPAPASVAPEQKTQQPASTGLANRVKQLLKPKQRPAQKAQPARPSLGYRDDPYR